VYLIARWRRDGAGAAVRSGAASGVLAAAAFAPYWAGGATFRGISSIAGQTSKSLAGSVARVIIAAQRLVDPSAGTSFAWGLVRVLGAAFVAGVVVVLARSDRTGREPWRASLVLTATYLAVTPWFLPWHVVGLVALAAGLPESPLALPALTFSGSCLAFVGGPGLVGPLATATVRYGPPALAWRRPSRLVPRWPGAATSRGSSEPTPGSPRPISPTSGSRRT
jgi:hypothetical protein